MKAEKDNIGIVLRAISITPSFKIKGEICQKANRKIKNIFYKKGVNS